jgi:hypothetical protein
MGTPVDEPLDLAEFVLGKQQLPLAVEGEAAVAILWATVGKLKDQLKYFEEGVRTHRLVVDLPDELTRPRLISVRSHIVNHRTGKDESELYCMTRSGRWVRIWTSFKLGEYQGHEWLGRGEMQQVMTDLPSLLGMLLEGLRMKAIDAEAKLQLRSSYLREAASVVRDTQARLGTLGSTMK